MKDTLKSILTSIRVYVINRLTQRDRRGAGLVGMPEAYFQKQKFQISFLRGIGLAPSDTLVDIGCGVLRGGIPIIEFLDESNYYGIDVREESIEIGKKELERAKLGNKRPQLIHCQSLLSVTLSNKVDKAWAFSVLFHLSDARLNECMLFVRNNLKSTGKFYANVKLGPNRQETWQDFPVISRSIEDYRTIANRYSLDVEVLKKLREYGHKSLTNPEEDDQVFLLFKHKEA